MMDEVPKRIETHDDFVLIYQKYSEKLFGYTFVLLKNKEEAEEVVQETFVKLWEKRSEILINSSLGAYLFKMSKNIILNRIREKFYFSVAAEWIKEERDVMENSTEETIDTNELQNILNEIISRLPAKRKEVFLLSRVENMTYKEIAAYLNISENTVDTQIRKSLEFIRQHLLKEGRLPIAVVVANTFIDITT